MSKENNKPEIRFKGHTDEWYKTSLGVVGKCQSGVGFPEREQGGDCGTPFYKVSDMNNYGNEHEMINANHYVTDEQINDNNWKVIDVVPSVIFAKVGAAIMLNRKRIVCSPFLFDNNMMAYKFDVNWDIDFGKTFFEKTDLRRFVQVGALPSYSASDIENLELDMPKIKIEQTNIGMFFKQLDNITSLNQRKYEKLSNMKKALLEKMFPQKGSKVPELRFKGYNENWLECEICNVINLCGGCDYKHLEIGDIPVYGTGGYMLSVSKAHSYKHDAIGIGRKGTIDRPFILKAPFWTVDTLFYALPKENNNLDFILSLFLNVDWRSKDQSTGVPSLSKNIINDSNVFVPEFKEQCEIGSILSKIDNLMILQKQKLDKLNNIKKALLEKMFV